MAKYNPYYQPVEEDDSGPGLGTLATLAAAASLASPVGAPIRRKLGEYASKADEYMGMPLKGLRASAKSEVLDPVKLATARAVNAMTGGADELAGRSYAKAMQGAPGTSDQFTLDALMQNLKQTGRGIKAAGKAGLDMASVTPEALSVIGKNRSAKELSKTALGWSNGGKNARIMDDDATIAIGDFMEKGLGKDLGATERLIVESLFANDKSFKTPTEAALAYFNILKKSKLLGKDLLSNFENS